MSNQIEQLQKKCLLLESLLSTKVDTVLLINNKQLVLESYDSILEELKQKRDIFGKLGSISEESKNKIIILEE